MFSVLTSAVEATERPNIVIFNICIINIILLYCQRVNFSAERKPWVIGWLTETVARNENHCDIVVGF